MRPAPTIVRSYKGKTQEQAARRFAEDAASLAEQGYHPISQSWAPGSYGCGSFIVALLLAVVLIGILIFVYMLFVKPDGTLTVTYEYRGVATSAVQQLAMSRGRIGGRASAGLYAKPHIGQQPSRLLAPGTLVEPGERRGVFTHVTIGGVNGWVRSDLVELGQFEAPLPATKRCPQCAEEVQLAAKICRFCRYDFSASSPSGD